MKQHDSTARDSTTVREWIPPETRKSPRSQLWAPGGPPQVRQRKMGFIHGLNLFINLSPVIIVLKYHCLKFGKKYLFRSKISDFC